MAKKFKTENVMNLAVSLGRMRVEDVGVKKLYRKAKKK